MNRAAAIAIRATAGVAVAWAVALSAARAQTPEDEGMTAEEFESTLEYQTGKVTLEGGMATIRLPKTFRFLGPEESTRLLVDGWGNPGESVEGVLGMLIPNAVSPMSEEGWGIVVSFDEDGYVSDDDASSIDYDDLLKEMQEATRSEDEDRKEEGFPTVELVGWAEPPSYDAATHKMYWAKELAFDSSPEHTLNYNIRILGRRGVLVLNAVASMDQLRIIHRDARGILPAVDFNEGHRYADYVEGTDKAATYGLTGLILGATAAKAGLFKVLVGGLLAFKKLILIGLIGLASVLKRLFGGKPAETT